MKAIIHNAGALLRSGSSISFGRFNKENLKAWLIYFACGYVAGTFIQLIALETANYLRAHLFPGTGIPFLLRYFAMSLLSTGLPLWLCSLVTYNTVLRHRLRTSRKLRWNEISWFRPTINLIWILLVTQFAAAIFVAPPQQPPFPDYYEVTQPLAEPKSDMQLALSKIQSAAADSLFALCSPVTYCPFGWENRYHGTLPRFLPLAYGAPLSLLLFVFTLPRTRGNLLPGSAEKGD